MYYTIYKITNNLTNKYYIGQHKTKNLDDGYMGSGKALRDAYKKYGKENFTKEILHIFETQEEMNNKEKELVVPKHLDENSYNLAEGGNSHGFDYINQNGGFGGHSKGGKTAALKGKNYLVNNPHIASEYGKKYGQLCVENGHMDKIRELAFKSPNYIMNKIFTCPHCNQTGGGGMVAWHFDNCKQNPNYIKRKMKQREYTTVTCPHCGVTGNGANMTRYHFDKCEQNPKSVPRSLTTCSHCGFQGRPSAGMNQHIKNCEAKKPLDKPLECAMVGST